MGSGCVKPHNWSVRTQTEWFTCILVAVLRAKALLQSLPGAQVQGCQTSTAMTLGTCKRCLGPGSSQLACRCSTARDFDHFPLLHQCSSVGCRPSAPAAHSCPAAAPGISPSLTLVRDTFNVHQNGTVADPILHASVGHSKIQISSLAAMHFQHQGIKCAGCAWPGRCHLRICGAVGSTGYLKCLTG